MNMFVRYTDTYAYTHTNMYICKLFGNVYFEDSDEIEPTLCNVNNAYEDNIYYEILSSAFFKLMFRFDPDIDDNTAQCKHNQQSKFR